MRRNSWRENRKWERRGHGNSRTLWIFQQATGFSLASIHSSSVIESSEGILARVGKIVSVILNKLRTVPSNAALPEKRKHMKTWITTLAIGALALAGAVTTAEARPHRGHESSSRVYISGYRSCGTPVYSERYLVGYDRCGSPIWRTRIVSPPRHYRPAPRYYSAPSCPPPHPAYGGYYNEGRRNSGIVIQGSFRL